MGLFDVLAMGLFVSLMYRLRDHYLEHRAKEANRMQQEESKGGQPAGESERGTGAELLKSANALAKEGGQDQITQVLFVLLLGCLVTPALFGGSEAPPSEFTASSLPSGAVNEAELSKEIHWITVDAQDSADSLSERLAPYGQHSGYFVGLVDLSSGAMDTIGASKAFVKTLAKNNGFKVRGASVATFGSRGYYSSSHALIDRTLEGVASTLPFKAYSIHGFGKTTPSDLKASIEECFSKNSQSFETCAGVLESPETQDCPSSVNSQIQRSVQATIRELKLNINADSSDPARFVAPQQYQQQQQHPTGTYSQKIAIADQEDEQYRPSFFKLFILWLTRILGFVVPFYETFVSLKNKEKRTGEWRAYWTIYAMVHFAEDVFFIRLVYLMPLYIFAKLAFLVWCCMPGPENSRFAYNQVVNMTNEKLATLRGKVSG